MGIKIHSELTAHPEKSYKAFILQLRSHGVSAEKRGLVESPGNELVQSFLVNNVFLICFGLEWLGAKPLPLPSAKG